MKLARTLASVLLVSASLVHCRSDDNRARTQRPTGQGTTAPTTPAADAAPSAPPAPIPEALSRPALPDAGFAMHIAHDNGCIAEHGGCPAPTRTVPACPAGTGSMAVLDIMAHRAAFARNRVAVRGFLARAAEAPTCATAACPDTNTCCNECTTALTLRANDASNAPQIVLRNADHPTEYTCVGDRTVTCCPFADTQNVIAVGVLAPGTTGPAVLQNPTLCVLDPTTLVPRVEAPDAGPPPAPTPTVSALIVPDAPVVQAPQAPPARPAARPGARPAARPAAR